MTILDNLIPVWDARRLEQREINAPSVVVMQSAIDADVLDAVRRSPVVKATFGIRSAAERAVAAIRRRPFTEPPAPASLRLSDLPLRGEWVRLGATPEEFTFGVVGRFWAGETKWETIDTADFVVFSQPGYARIACNLRVIPLGTDRTLLSYEARTKATDPGSRRTFLRYWRVVSPFVGIVMRSTLAVIAEDSTVSRAHDVPNLAGAS
jgi:hypothetical protein